MDPVRLWWGFLWRIWAAHTVKGTLPYVCVHVCMYVHVLSVCCSSCLLCCCSSIYLGDIMGVGVGRTSLSACYIIYSFLLPTISSVRHVFELKGCAKKKKKRVSLWRNFFDYQSVDKIWFATFVHSLLQNSSGTFYFQGKEATKDVGNKDAICCHLLVALTCHVFPWFFVFIYNVRY